MPDLTSMPPVEECPVHGQFTVGDGHFVLHLSRSATATRPAEQRRFCGECYIEFIARNVLELRPGGLAFLDADKSPAVTYWVSFASWSQSSSPSFIYVRIYYRGWWTPIVKVIERF